MRFRWLNLVLMPTWFWSAPQSFADAEQSPSPPPGVTDDAGIRRQASMDHAKTEVGVRYSLRIERDAQERIGLTLATVQPAQLRAEIIALGKLEEDPRGSFVVRAAVAGYLRADPHDWPTLGAVLRDGTPLGVIEPRLTPMEQLDLASRRLEVGALVQETEAELEAARASYEGKLVLSANGKMVSDRELEEAAARVESNEAKLAAAQCTLELLEDQGKNPAGGLGSLPVTVERGGQVVEAPVRPGEIVDSGQVLLRVASFERLIARVELPLGETWDAMAGAQPRIGVIGVARPVVAAKLVGRAARVGADTRGETWLLAVRNEQGTLRPGTPVVAHLPQAGEPLHGVLIPERAIVRYGGLTWVFVRTDKATYERRDVPLHSPTPDGWFVTEGVTPGEMIVVTGAQALLSEQLKEQIEAEEESAE